VVVQLNGGQKLRALREALGYRMREVEVASTQIAQRFDSEEFAISPSRLSDIETKGVIPSIFRFYSFAAIYRREYRELLSFYGLELDGISADLGEPQFTLQGSSLLHCENGIARGLFAPSPPHARKYKSWARGNAIRALRQPTPTNEWRERRAFSRALLLQVCRDAVQFARTPACHAGGRGFESGSNQYPNSAPGKLSDRRPDLGDIVPGVFTPVLAKHSKSFSRIDCISVGVDRMQRNFEPMRKQVEAWQRSELTDVTAKVVIYEAFVEGMLEAPKHLARTVHDLYFEPRYEEFRSRTIWSLSNAFTSAFKELDPIPQFKATAKLGGFLETRFSGSF